MARMWGIRKLACQAGVAEQLWICPPPPSLWRDNLRGSAGWCSGGESKVAKRPTLTQSKESVTHRPPHFIQKSVRSRQFGTSFPHTSASLFWRWFAGQQSEALGEYDVCGWLQFPYSKLHPLWKTSNGVLIHETMDGIRRRAVMWAGYSNLPTLSIPCRQQLYRVVHVTFGNDRKGSI